MHVCAESQRPSLGMERAAPLADEGQIFTLSELMLTQFCGRSFHSLVTSLLYTVKELDHYVYTIELAAV